MTTENKATIVMLAMLAAAPVSAQDVTPGTLPFLNPDSVDFADIPCDVVAAIAGNIMEARQVGIGRATAFGSTIYTYREMMGLSQATAIGPKAAKLFRQILDEVYLLPSRPMIEVEGVWRGRCEFWPKQKKTRACG